MVKIVYNFLKMRLKIFDCDGKLLTIFSEGEHKIGRCSRLECNDYRVSRGHALLIIDKQQAILQAEHFNPCYYKSASTNNTIIVKNKCKQQLHNDDKFGFLPDKFWYKVELIMDEEEVKQIKHITTTTTIVTPNTSNSNDVPIDAENKRQSADEETDSNNHSTKKIKIENNYTMTTIDDSFTFIVNEIPKDEDVQSQESSDKGDEFEAKDNNNINEQQSEAPTQLNTLNEVDLPDNNNQPSTSSDNNDNQQKRQCRERCWYGADCYRKNPQHHQEFSHPNDSDYASDPDDNRPVCSYGAMCYRRNKTHRQTYKHPIGPPPKNQLKKKKDKTTTTRTKRKKAKDPEETPDDDYDYDDPFLDDGDSDEYVESSSDDDDDDDTDWEDVEATQENSDDVKRLLKEAKRFTKNPK